MLKVVAAMARQAGVPCQVSLETVMACGMGACLGCAVTAEGKPVLHACTDGPVLAAERLWG